MEPQQPNDPRSRDVVAAYRRERMPLDRRAAAWDRLQAAIADEAPTAAAPRPERRRDLIWGVVLVAAAVVVVIFGARGRATDQAHQRDAGSQAAHGAVGSTDSPVLPADPPNGTRATPPPADEPPPPPVMAPPPPPRASAARSPDVPKDMPALDAELALLRAARAALAEGRAAAALPSLEQHAREFPAGHLQEERMLLRAQAQCELGRREEARASAAALVQRFPQSPHARTAAGLCEP